MNFETIKKVLSHSNPRVLKEETREKIYALLADSFLKEKDGFSAEERKVLLILMASQRPTAKEGVSYFYEFLEPLVKTANDKGLFLDIEALLKPLGDYPLEQTSGAAYLMREYGGRIHDLLDGTQDISAPYRQYVSAEGISSIALTLLFGKSFDGDDFDHLLALAQKADGRGLERILEWLKDSYSATKFSSWVKSEMTWTTRAQLIEFFGLLAPHAAGGEKKLPSRIWDALKCLDDSDLSLKFAESYASSLEKLRNIPSDAVDAEWFISKTIELLEKEKDSSVPLYNLHSRIGAGLEEKTFQELASLVLRKMEKTSPSFDCYFVEYFGNLLKAKAGHAPKAAAEMFAFLCRSTPQYSALFALAADLGSSFFTEAALDDPVECFAAFPALGHGFFPRLAAIEWTDGQREKLANALLDIFLKHKAHALPDGFAEWEDLYDAAEHLIIPLEKLPEEIRENLLVIKEARKLVC